MAFAPDPLLAALASGTTVVTPNNRLARALVARFDEAQRRAGRWAWPAARALPWNAWLATLWQDAVEADAVDPALRLLSSAQSNFLWRRIVAAQSGMLIDPAGAARLAAEAWALLHEWGAGGESWRSWTSDSAVDDTATFAAWAVRYHATLGESRAHDGAGLADRLAALAPRVGTWNGATIALSGFTELSPQQGRLVAALTAAGARIESLATLPTAAGQIWRSAHASKRDEIAAALAWARGVALARPEAAVAIVVPDLAQRRAEVAALAEDILCPALQWPGREETTRPYNISLGTRVTDVDIVAAALDFVNLAHAPLRAGRVAALVRSPYFPGGRDLWLARAGLERRWLEQGRGDVSLGETIAELELVDPELARRWRSARESNPITAATTPRAWADAWRSLLAGAGWPGERTLRSDEFQARGAWDDTLVEFAGIATLAGRMQARDAIAALRDTLASRIFQPEAAAAPIQILGLLEAAGTPFDALWVAGLDAESWPRAPEPNPMLPLAWQRERGVPRSSAASELAHARALTAQFACTAPDVVFSHARDPDEERGFPSALLPPGKPLPSPHELEVSGTAGSLFAARPSLEYANDAFAPAIAPDTPVRGGAGIVAAQANCPFQAVATYRLRADPWPAPQDGLSPIERGNLVHDALARFWEAVRTQQALVALTPEALDQAIATHVAAAIRALDPLRRRSLPPAVLAQEAPRIAALLLGWMTGFERVRPPFTVESVERRIELALAGLVLTLRIDRIDALRDGGVAIIDYKTGEIERPARWIEARPRAPQLGLYALAYRAAELARPLRALAYAKLRRGEIEVAGVAADESAWAGLGAPGKPGLPYAGWLDLEAHWRTIFEAMCTEIRTGRASVTPRDVGPTCRLCKRQALCRIGAAALAVEDGGDDE